MEITKDTIIGEVVNENPDVAPVLMNAGLHCLGCAMASGETIEEACYVHGLDCDKLISDINDFLNQNKA